MSEILGLGSPAPTAATDDMSAEELRQLVQILEARVAGLRGLSTPGLIIGAFEEIAGAARHGLAIAEQQVLFWSTVKAWADRLGAEEKADWGDLA